MRIYIGLDVHCKQTVYVVQHETGKILAEGSVPTTLEGIEQMLASVGAPQGTKIAMESGTQAWWVSRLLSSLGMQPVVVNAQEVRAKARRQNQKSDRRDAFEICDGLRRGIYNSIVYVPDIEIQRLRQIISRRRHFVRLCTAEVNAAKFLLRSVGLGEEAVSLTTVIAWEKLMKRLDGNTLREYIAMHAEVWALAQKQVEALDEKLEKAAEPFDETMKHLASIPGVGPITAATFIATLGTPQRFPSSSEVVSYTGLAVATYSSGEKERYGHITKRGGSELRAMLCEAAQHASRPTHPLNPYFVRACAKGGYKKAVVGVAQRLARILYQLWKKQEDFDVRKLNIVADRVVKSRMTYYRIRQVGELKVSRISA